MASIIVDTGPLYALADRDDAWHHRTVRFLENTQDALIVPASVLPEAAYLLLTHLGPAAERQLLQSVINGELTVEELSHTDYRRALEILRRYESARLGLVDATVMAMAERMKISRILTTDRRDFSIVRPRHCKAFELLP